MNQLSDVLAETPSDVIDLILDLTIKFKIDNTDFDKYIELLQKWHNKKIVRQLILEKTGVIFNVKINYQLRDKIETFIVELIKLDEIGLAKNYYDLLITTIENSYDHYASLDLIEKFHNYLFYKFNVQENIFKIANQYYLFSYYRTNDEYEKEDDEIFKMAIKTKSIIFLILRCHTVIMSNYSLHLIELAEEIIKPYNKDERNKINDKFYILLDPTYGEYEDNEGYEEAENEYYMEGYYDSDSDSFY